MTARTFALAVVAAALPALASAAAPAPKRAPWDGPPLLGDPAAILAAADALAPPRGADVDTLLEEGLFELDARGAATFTYRVVFRPLSAEAARSWARVSATWAPWHQARPEIRARVVTPDGVAHLLDPATLADAGVRDAGEEMFTDRRALAGPLPAVRAGAVVEEVITVRDTAPFFEGGTVQRFFLAGASPTRLVRVRVRAPAALPLRHVVKGLPLKPKETVADGVRTLVVERTDAPPVRASERGVPDATALPYVAFATGRSWADVAARYGAVLDRQLSGSDLKASAEAAGGGATDRRERVRRIVAWMHANVRYTGLELGEAAVVPATPADTLARRYGDCKDLSLLLVGLLRASGLDARVALVRAEGPDLDPELPGFGAFDHAIVRVDGAEPIWIDATDPDTAPGSLPPPVQGRLALVVPDGKDLARTPESTPADNRLRITRTFHLAELGTGRIVEERTLTGAFAAEERRLRSRIPAAQRKEAEERFAKEVFHAERHVGTRTTGLDDPSQDVTVRVEVDGSQVALTADDAAEVPVTPDGLFEPFPPAFAAPEGRGGASLGDLVLPIPYRAEVIYRVLPPEGFRPRPPPDALERRFGPAVLARTAAIEKDGSITVRWTFDSGGRRLAAADASALAAEVRRLSKDRPVTVRLERTGAALLAAGQVPEALAEMRRLAALHPNEASHHLHLAVGLVSLGFQEAALAEARRAISLEPKSAWAQRVLSWILSHDAVGRLYGPGFDRAGAIAAARRAKELDPSHAGGRAALAGLLAMNADGVRFGPGAALDEAIGELRAIRDELGERTHDDDLLAASYAAGRIDDVVALAREMERSDARDATLVAALAIRDGAEAAISDSERLGEGRRQALQGAIGLLVQARRYPLASAVAAAAAKGAPNAAALRAQADTLADVRRWEELMDEGDAPTRLVRRLFRALYLSPTPEKDVAALVSERGARSPGAPPPAAAGEAPRGGAPVEAGVVRRFMRDSGARPDVLLDLTLGRLQLSTDGDEATGWRVRLQLPFGGNGRGGGSTLFLVKEKKGLAILASDELLPVIGAEAIRRLDAGDAAGARKLMEWARAELPPGEGDDGSPGAVVGGLWRAGGDAGDGQVRRAAAALLAFGERTAPAVPILEQAFAAERDPGARRLLGYALAQAYRGAGRDADLLRVADGLLKDDPASRPAFAAKAAALLRLKRAADVPKAADAILARLPDDPQILRTVAGADMSAGALDAAAAAWKRLLDGGRAMPLDYNNAAWLELFRADPPPKLALDWARRATEGGREASEASLNTLAALYAALRKPGEAREVFVQSMQAGGARAPQGEDWLVFGWIAEGFGLPDVAASAYRKVKVEPADPVGPGVLARRRLSRLGGTAARPQPASTRPEASPRGGSHGGSPPRAPESRD